MRNTSLLAAVAFSFELGAVTSANSQPVVPLAGLGPAEGGVSAAATMTKKHGNGFHTIEPNIEFDRNLISVA